MDNINTSVKPVGRGATLPMIWIEEGRIYDDFVSEVNLATSPKIDKPPLLIKLTGYRLLNITIIVTFGVSKAVLAYKQRSTALTAVDWISGVVFTIGLWWLGLYESVNPPIAPWFFHSDLATNIYLLIILSLFYGGFFVIFVSSLAGVLFNTFGSVAWLLPKIYRGFSNAKLLFYLGVVPTGFVAMIPVILIPQLYVWLMFKLFSTGLYKALTQHSFLNNRFQTFVVRTLFVIASVMLFFDPVSGFKVRSFIILPVFRPFFSDMKFI